MRMEKPELAAVMLSGGDVITASACREETACVDLNTGCRGETLICADNEVCLSVSACTCDGECETDCSSEHHIVIYDNGHV